MSFKYTGTENLEIMLDAKNYNSFIASLILKQHLPISSKIVDIGAGIGLFAEMIESKGYKVHCVEPDIAQAEKLKEKGFTVSSSIEEIADESCDFLYALNVLEHIENDKEALILWKKKLKNGGKILIYVPAFKILFSSLDVKVEHFRRYNRKMLTTVITNAGLNPIKKAQYADSLGFFVTLLFKLVGNKNGEINKTGLILFDKIIFPISRFCDFFFKNLFGKNVFIVAEKNNIKNI